MNQGASIMLTLRERAGYVDVESFVTATRALTVILREVGSAIPGGPGEGLRWGVCALRSDGGTLEAVAIPKDCAAAQASHVIAACVAGLKHLEHHADPPEFFTDTALVEAKALVNLLERDVGRIAVAGANQRAVITQHVAAHVDEILARGYTTPISVEGQVESISLHDRPIFGLRERLGGRRVECHFPRKMLDDVREALGRRVLVTGNIRVSEVDDPPSIQVAAIRAFPPEEELPSTDRIRGLDRDFTGPTDSATHVRGLYDA